MRPSEYLKGNDALLTRLMIASLLALGLASLLVAHRKREDPWGVIARAVPHSPVVVTPPPSATRITANS